MSNTTRKWHNHESSSMIDDATCIFFHVDNFLHVSPLRQCRWFFSKLWQPICCGDEHPPGTSSDCRWVITNIVNSSNQSISLDQKRRKRAVQLLVQPNTSILFTFSSYRIVVCLEINRAIYSIRSDGGTAADEMINSLITMLEEIHKTLQAQKHISRVYVTVIAHHSEINMTYGIWQKEINKTTTSTIPPDFFSMYRKIIQDLTFQRQINPCVLAGGDSKQWTGAEGMNMSSIIEGIFFHLNILPMDACPIAVLITPGVVEVQVAQITKSLAKANIPIHVLLVTLSSDTQPLGCVPEIGNLRVLAEASGGSFETVSPATKQNLESIGQIFLRPFYACRAENSHLRESSSTRDARLKLYESRLHGYQLQGLTVEHVVASRLIDGYTIIGITTEMRSQETEKLTFITSGKTCVHIRLERNLTKVSSITYIVSYFTDQTPKQYSMRRSKSDGDSSGYTFYGTGILSIEIICKCPQKVFSRENHRYDQQQQQQQQQLYEESATTAILINEARAIFDYDNRISLILKLRGMPGYVPTFPFGGNEIELDGIDSEYLKKTPQDVFYRQSLMFNQFNVSSDILENLCYLNEYQEGYLYLIPHSPFSTDSHAIPLDQEKRTLIFNNIRNISSQLKFFVMSGTKWLCFSTLISTNQLSSDFESYDLFVIEIDHHLESSFLTVKFSSLGNSPGDKCYLTLEQVLKNIQASLQIFHYHSIRLNRNLSLLSTTLSSSSRQNQLTYSYLTPIFKFYEIDLLANPQIFDSYLLDFKKSKRMFGLNDNSTFLVSNGSNGSITKLHFSGILSISPSGMNLDSILQCCLECSDEGIFISYYLEPSYETANLIAQDPFQMTRVLDIPLGQSTDVAIEKISPIQPNLQISNLLQSLLNQDSHLFDYYFATTSVYNYLPNLPEFNTNTPHQSIVINENYWTCLQSYSYTRKFFLPALTSPDHLENEITHYIEMNKSLLELLHNSLHEMNFTHIEVIGSSFLSIQSDYIFCVSLKNGILIIDINSKSVDLHKSDIGARTPTLNVQETKGDNSSSTTSVTSIEVSSSTTDEDEPRTPEQSNDLHRITPTAIKMLERFDSRDLIEGNDHPLVACTPNITPNPTPPPSELKFHDPLANSISVHYRFISIPLEALPPSDLQQSHEILKSSQQLSTDMTSTNNSSSDNSNYNQIFLDTNECLQQYHGVNFSRIVYSYLLLHPHEMSQSANLQRALSYCKMSAIEMEVEILYRLKKYATNTFSDLQSSLELPLYGITLGKYLIPIVNDDCFLFFSSNNDHSFNLFLDPHLNIYNHGIFIKLFLIQKNQIRNINEDIEISSQDININNFFVDIFNKYYLLGGENRYDDILFSSTSDDNVSLKIEIYSAGYQDISNDLGLQKIQQILTYELETLINYDTLYTLLVLPEVTRENIVLVQHCLRSTRDLFQSTFSFDFLVPSSGQGLMYLDKILQFFEEELLIISDFNKIGDIIYARQWSLRSLNENGEMITIVIPSWILLTVSQTSLLDEENLADNMQIISMEISVVLFVIGENQSKQDIVMEEISNKLKKACHRANQKTLLKDLNSTRLASSYLIKVSAGATPTPTPPTTTDSPTKTEGSSSHTRQNRLQQMKNKDVISTFTIPVDTPSPLPLYRRSDFISSCFECEIQGRIDLVLPADVSNVLNNSLSHSHTITMLESAALHPFAISNVRKCFVYQHKNGDIYYMAFAPTKDEKDRVVSLLVYGVSELNMSIKTELKKVLEVKLTEHIANIISISMKARRTVLPTTHVQFLRDCGLSKRVDFVYHLPDYVTDPYFFCVIAKQLFSKSELFMVLTIQYNDRQEHLASLLHPAMYGYDDTRQTVNMNINQNETNSMPTGKMNHQSIFRPHLERKKQVDKELCSVHAIHPIFFDRTKQLQTSRNEKRYDGSMVVWDQGDFTLLYNTHGPDKNKRNISQKRGLAQSGGLALIEFQPISEFELLAPSAPQSANTSTPNIESPQSTPVLTPATSTSMKEKTQPQVFATGSEELLLHDVNRLIEHIKIHQNVSLDSAKLHDPHTKPENHHHHHPSHTPNHLVVRIYPTRGINPKTLMEGLHAFFHQTLIHYSLERLFSAYNNQTIPRQQNFHLETRPNDSLKVLVQELTPFSTSTAATDLFKSYQQLILHNSSDVLPCTSHLTIRIQLSLSNAKILHRRILSSIVTQFPHLVNLTVIPTTLHVNNNTNESVEWLDPQEDLNVLDSGITSCLFGDNFLTIEGKKYAKDFYKWKGTKEGHLVYVPPDNYSIDTVNSLRHIPDYVPDKSLLFPLWLRKRRYSIEVTITPTGIHVFFFNIEKKHIDSIKSIIQDYSNEMLVTIQKKQGAYLQKINFTSMTSQQQTQQQIQQQQSQLDSNDIHHILKLRLTLQIQGLFWSEKVLSRLYLFSSRGLATNSGGNLANQHLIIQNELKDIPFRIWSEGILLKRVFVSLPNYFQYAKPPSTNLLDGYFEYLSHLLRSFDCYFLKDLETKRVSILLPIPSTSSLYIIQLECYSTCHLGITNRVIDCSNIIHSIAREYHVENADSLISPVTRSHLQLPSIGTPSENESEINIMELVYSNSTIHKLNMTIIYSMLANLYFNSYPSSGGNLEIKGNGTRILSTLKMIYEVMPGDVHMEVKTITFSSSSSSSSSSMLSPPTINDIIEMYSQPPLCAYVDCIPYEGSTQKFALFRFIASTLPATASATSRGSRFRNKPNKSNRKPSEIKEMSVNERTQRKTHSIYSDSILGLTILEPNHDNLNTFQVTTLLFCGNKIIGNEKELIHNSELEERLHQQLSHLKYFHTNQKNILMKNIYKTISQSIKLSNKLILTQRAWEILYSNPSSHTSPPAAAASSSLAVAPPPPSPSILSLPPHNTFKSTSLPPSYLSNGESLLSALLFHSNVVSLKFLNFILPLLIKLLKRVEYQQMFIGVMQRVFQQRFVYFIIPPSSSSSSITATTTSSSAVAVPTSTTSSTILPSCCSSSTSAPTPHPAPAPLAPPLSTSSNTKNTREHYLIIGPTTDPSLLSSSTSFSGVGGGGSGVGTFNKGRYFLDIQLINSNFCEVRLVESNYSNYCFTNIEKLQQQKLIENFVDLILYLVGIICDDEIKLMKTSY